MLLGFIVLFLYRIVVGIFNLNSYRNNRLLYIILWALICTQFVNVKLFLLTHIDI